MSERPFFLLTFSSSSFAWRFCFGLFIELEAQVVFGYNGGDIGAYALSSSSSSSYFSCLFHVLIAFVEIILHTYTFRYIRF